MLHYDSKWYLVFGRTYILCCYERTQDIYVITKEQFASVYTPCNLFCVGLEMGCFFRVSANLRFTLNLTAVNF